MAVLDDKDKASGSTASATAGATKPAPLGERRVAGTTALAQRRLRSATTSKVEDVDGDNGDAAADHDDAMAVDPPAHASSRRRSARINPASVLAATSTSASTEPTGIPVRRPLASVNGRKATASASTANARGRPVAGTRRIVVHTEGGDDEPVVEEEKPAQKKRRTSSVGAEEKEAEKERERGKRRMLEELEQEEISVKERLAREEVKWDDLDKEDEGDPNMVAEYVVEIYEYLKYLEVRIIAIFPTFVFPHTPSRSAKRCPTLNIWTIKRSWHGKCAAY